MLWQSSVLRRLWHRITDVHREMQTSDQHHKQKDKIRVCKKTQRWARRVLELCLWTDEIKINLYLSDGKAKCGSANDPKHTALSVNHGGGVVMAWTCMAVPGTGPLIFTDDLMYECMKTVAEWSWKGTKPSCLNIQENATRFIGKWYIYIYIFILYQNNDPKHPVSSVKDFIRAKKWKVLDCPSQSPDLNLIEHELHRLKRRVNAETVGIGSIKVWESILKDETNDHDHETSDVYVSQTHCCDCVQGICN